MGYSTDFTGSLDFTENLPASVLAEVKKFFSEDCRDHPEWKNSEGLYYVDLEFTDDFSGIQWNGAEKTYDMVGVINMILINMRDKYPMFSLEGRMEAQGEDIDDRWSLVMKGGLAEKVDMPRIGEKICCPRCGQDFYLEELE